MARGLKILALVTDAYGGYGGIAQYNRDLFAALELSDRVAAVHVLPRAGRADSPSHKIAPYAPRRSRSGYSAQALALAAATRFDLVFCGHLFHAPLAAMICRLTGAKLWLQAHGVEVWARPGRLIRAAVARADLVTAVSRYTRRRLLGWSNVDPACARVLANCVRPMFSSGRPDGALLQRYGLGSARLILTVSRLETADAYKGHYRVLEALPAILRGEPDVLFVIAGDGGGRVALEAKAQALGLRHAVRFLGRVDDAELLALYRSADLFLMPSAKEGFGIVFLEAAACGLPVIAGRGDGSVDALVDGALGALVDPNSSAEIAAAALAALRAPRRPAPDAVARFGFNNFSAHVDALLRTVAH
jgi:phosphatidylinositol alpha-1,6-mannosyltransferase